MMGAIKFMMPNELGIYLHDTPDKALLTRAKRALSAGCVRLERPWELAEWLFGERPVAQSNAQEHEVRLEEPTPVYIAYLTASPTPDGIRFYPDVYRRERDPVVRG